MVSVVDKLSIKLIRLVCKLIKGKPADPTRSTYITLPTHNRRVKINLYYPPSPSSTGEDHLVPVHLSLHSAGFTLPFLNSNGAFLSQLAREAGAIVIDADYAKGPEDPWPQPVDDVDDLIRWARKGGDQKEVNKLEEGVKDRVKWVWDKERISVGGNSSGGNLALIGSTRGEKNGGVCAVAAFYPSTKLSQSANDKHSPPKASSPNGAGGPIPPFIRSLFYRCYLPPNVDRSDPAVSPVFAPAASFPPNVFVVVCEADALKLEAQELTGNLRKARDAGKWKGRVEEWEAKGQGHGWDLDSKPNTGADKVREEAWKWMIDHLEEAYAQKGDQAKAGNSEGYSVDPIATNSA